jgi:hypothetical protein
MLSQFQADFDCSYVLATYLPVVVVEAVANPRNTFPSIAAHFLA